MLEMVTCPNCDGSGVDRSLQILCGPGGCRTGATARQCGMCDGDGRMAVARAAWIAEGRRRRDDRLRRFLTQRDEGERLGVTRQRLSQAETGLRDPREVWPEATVS